MSSWKKFQLVVLMALVLGVACLQVTDIVRRGEVTDFDVQRIALTFLVHPLVLWLWVFQGERFQQARSRVRSYGFGVFSVMILFALRDVVVRWHEWLSVN